MRPNSLKMPKRIVIRPQDVVNIMGVKLRTAYRIMDKIRRANGKSKHACVTIDEFSAYTKIPEEKIGYYILD